MFTPKIIEKPNKLWIYAAVIILHGAKARLGKILTNGPHMKFDKQNCDGFIIVFKGKIRI